MRYNPRHPLVLALKGWDEVKPTAECFHCEGTGLAPGDGTTECGFCENNERGFDQ